MLIVPGYLYNTLMLIAGLVTLYGLLIGSFINALVWRLHNGKSIVAGRSMCPHCSHALRPVDLIPVVSFVALGGKCRDCHKPISIQYPLVELATAVLFGLSYLALMPQTSVGWVSFLVWLYILGSFMVLFIYDLRWMLLPDKVVFPAIIVAYLHTLALYWLGAPTRAVVGPQTAAVVFGGAFLALAVAGRGKWMGGGDVKLVTLMGLVLGFKLTLLALFIAFVAGGAVGASLIILRGSRRPKYIAFGPFLITGSVVAMLVGTPVVDWYLRMVGL
jgi:prepilin signal peptidase PulO-like enzyme (type II secretory pathway)